jgi:multidrug efflux pump subunit AcrB
MSEETLGVSGRLARFFLDSPLTPLIALVSLLLGVFAVPSLRNEEEPQINVTMATS